MTTDCLARAWYSYYYYTIRLLGPLPSLLWSFFFLRYISSSTAIDGGSGGNNMHVCCCACCCCWWWVLQVYWLISEDQIDDDDDDDDDLYLFTIIVFWRTRRRQTDRQEEEKSVKARGRVGTEESPYVDNAIIHVVVSGSWIRTNIIIRMLYKHLLGYLLFSILSRPICLCRLMITYIQF